MTIPSPASPSPASPAAPPPAARRPPGRCPSRRRPGPRSPARHRLGPRPVPERRRPDRLRRHLPVLPGPRGAEPPRAVRPRQSVALGAGPSAHGRQRCVLGPHVVRQHGLVRGRVRDHAAVRHGADARVADPDDVRPLHGRRALGAEPQHLHGRRRRQRRPPHGDLPGADPVRPGLVAGRPARVARRTARRGGPAARAGHRRPGALGGPRPGPRGGHRAGRARRHLVAPGPAVGALALRGRLVGGEPLPAARAVPRASRRSGQPRAQRHARRDHGRGLSDLRDRKVWYKIQGTRWQDGTALYYPLNLDYFTPWPKPCRTSWGPAG